MNKNRSPPVLGIVMASNTKFRLAICGGGIGGLTLALVLHKHYKQDIQIDIYEAKDKFAEIGAGIALWRGTWSIMQLLGLDTALEKVMAGPPDETPRPSFAFRRGDQFEESENFHRMVISRKLISIVSVPRIEQPVYLAQVDQ